MKILEKIIQIIKKIGKKAPKTLATGATIATVGIATGCGENKEVVVDKQIKVVQEDNYKSSLKVLPGSLGKEISQKIEQETIESQISQIKDRDTLLRFVKNEFLEEYEKKTGDSNLTTEDIEIWERTQDRVYVDETTGDMYTHGETPEITEQKLTEHGISYYEKENVEIYEINKKDGEVIDCAALVDENLEKVMLSRDLLTGKEYAGILATEKFGKMIPKVFEWLEFMEQESELGITRSKNQIIEILKEYQYKSKNQEIASKNNDGLEHE